MNRFCLFIFLSFFLFSNSANANKEIRDSVRTILNDSNMPDSLKVVRISELAFLDYNISPDENSSKEYMDQIFPLAKKLNGYDHLIPVYSTLAFIEDDPSHQSILIDSCLLLIEKSQSQEVKAIGWQSIGNMMLHDSKALNYYFDALDEIKGKGFYVLETSLYKDISSYYSARNDHFNQIKYAKLALESAQKSKVLYDIAEAWNDLGVAYYEVPSDDFMEDALEAFNKAKEIYENEIEDLRNGSNSYVYMVVCVNLSNVYFSKDDMDLATKYINEALVLALEYNQQEIQIDCYKRLSSIAKSRKDYDSAEKYLLKAIELLPEIHNIGTSYSHLSYSIHLELASLYSEAGKYKDAALYFQAGVNEYMQLHDLEITSANQKLAASYEEKRNQYELESLNENLTLKNRQNLLFILAAIIIIIAIVLLYYLQRYRIKTTRQKEQQKKSQAKLLELSRQQAELEARLNIQESSRLQKELLDGNMVVEDKNKILEDLKQYFAQHSELNKYKNQIESILLQQNRIESNLEEFKTGLQDVPPGFYNLLQEKADQKLTPLNLKYCRLMYTGLSSQEMADYLHVDLKTIRVSKHRLKQKLNLDKDEDLSAYLKNLI